MCSRVVMYALESYRPFGRIYVFSTRLALEVKGASHTLRKTKLCSVVTDVLSRCTSCFGRTL